MASTDRTPDLPRFGTREAGDLVTDRSTRDEWAVACWLPNAVHTRGTLPAACYWLAARLSTALLGPLGSGRFCRPGHNGRLPDEHVASIFGESQMLLHS
jgi:hypothetical protein